MNKIYVKRKSEQGASETIGKYTSFSQCRDAVLKDIKTLGLSNKKMTTYPRRNNKFLVDIGNKNVYYVMKAD